MPTQLTLVALYGTKSATFSAAIALLQQLATQTVGSAFTPYSNHQIHATIIGLERHRAPALNANFSKHRSRDIAMDFPGLLEYLRGCGHFPFEIQLGGFADRDYPFTSRKTTPFHRSFSVQADKVVVMGWPIRGEPISMPITTSDDAIHEARIYPPTLDNLRHAMQRYGVLHGYHRAATDVDNDLFFRIGLLDQNATTPATINTLELQARQLLSAQQPIVIEIRLEDCYIAAYDDDRLPVSTTRTWSLADPSVTGQLLAGLFT